jgi:hypothetical protein
MTAKNRQIFSLGLLAAGILALHPIAARADDPPPVAGRLSYLEGSVSFHDGTQDQWSYAAVNYPVTSGQSFWTDKDGRSEIQVGSSAIRMDNSTELDVLKMDGTTTQLQLDQGTINYDLVSLDPGQSVEIETPHGAVSLVQPGTYHIDAGDDTNPTLVASLQGESRFIGPHSYVDIGAGEQATAIGDPASYTMTEAATTPFDDWALQRQQSEQPVAAPRVTEGESIPAPAAPSQTAKYVSPQVTGYQDLDQYGTWQTTPNYGAVWVPASVPAEWAPYHAGHWAWVDPWGWTWIDDQPWGFAPFHYGRWAQVNQQWAWVPGPIVARPVYAPALVAFIGGVPQPGVNVGVGINLGGLSIGASIGWLPLGPNEVYYPPYHPSFGYMRGMNQGIVNNGVMNRINRTTYNNYYNNSTHTTVNNYANASAATVVPQQAFTHAQPVQRAAISATPAQLSALPVSQNLSALKPTTISRAAALPAAAHPVGKPANAPGPSEQQQQHEIQEIQHETPKSLNTANVPQAKPVEGQAQPEGASRTANPQERAEAPHPPGEVASRPEVQSAAKPETEAVPKPAMTAAEHRTAEPQKAEIRTAQAAHEPGEQAPGPAIRKVSTNVPLRQKQLAASLAQHPEAASQPAAKPAAEQAASKPASDEAVAKPAAPKPAPVKTVATQKAVPEEAAFHPAAVQHPQQSAPLRATPAGWHRDAPAPVPAAKAAAPAPKDDKPVEKKDDKSDK